MTEFISPITGETLQVAINDFENKMNWKDAVEACDYLKNGWRLPFKSELLIMYKEIHKKDLGNFYSGGYWAKSQTAKDKSWIVLFENGVSQIKDIEDKFFVRAVRAII